MTARVEVDPALVSCSVRYALGRHSYLPGLVADRDRLRDAVAAHHDCCCTDLWPELRDEP